MFIPGVLWLRRFFCSFCGEECIDILLNYKYCLRLDVDTFLCEGILNLDFGEKDIITGTAAYASETARKKLPVIISILVASRSKHRQYWINLVFDY